MLRAIHKGIGALLLVAICASTALASEFTFSKQFMDYEIISLLKLPNGGSLACVSGYPILIWLDKEGNVISSWEYQIRGLNCEFIKVITTSDGGLAAIGNVLLGDQLHPLIVRLDKNGSPLWQIELRARFLEQLNWIQQTSDGGYIAVGYSVSNGQRSLNPGAWILKLTASGKVAWSKALGNDQWEALQFAKQTPDGSYVVAGTLGSGVLIAKLSQSGKLVWSHAYSAPESAQLDVSAVRTAENGSMVLAGSYSDETGLYGLLMKVESNGTLIWRKAYSPVLNPFVSVDRTNDGGYVAAGLLDAIRGPLNSGILVKVDSTGKLKWAREALSDLLFVAQAADGGLQLVGSGANFQGILKTNENGLIPGCDLMERHTPKVKVPQISVTRNQELKLLRLPVKVKPLIITRKMITVAGNDYCK